MATTRRRDIQIGIAVVVMVLITVLIAVLALELTKISTPPPPLDPPGFKPYSGADMINLAAVSGFETPAIQNVLGGNWLGNSQPPQIPVIHVASRGHTWNVLQNNSVGCSGSVLIGQIAGQCLVATGTVQSGFTLGFIACTGASGVTAAHWFIEDGFENQASKSARMRNCENSCYITRQTTGLSSGALGFTDYYNVRCLTIPEGQQGNQTMDFYFYQPI